MKTQGGAIFPATVVTDRQVLQGPAQRIFNAAGSSRKLAGGTSIPVVVADEGVPTKFMSGPAIPMLNLTNRKVRGGPAMLVYPVDASGAYDSSFAEAAVSYNDKVLTIVPGNLIAFWPQNEAAGIIADNYEGTAARDGTYMLGPVLGQPGIGDGDTCPFYDGINDNTNIYSVSLNAAFSGAEGTMATWFRVFNAGVWTDGQTRRIFCIRVDVNNLAYISKAGGANTVSFEYHAGGVVKIRNEAMSPIVWTHLAMTWSAVADEVKFYVDGAQVGATLNGLGVWAGNLNVIMNCIGALDIGGTARFHGWIAKPLIYTAPLSQPQIAQLATV